MSQMQILAGQCILTVVIPGADATVTESLNQFLGLEFIHNRPPLGLNSESFCVTSRSRDRASGRSTIGSATSRVLGMAIPPSPTTPPAALPQTNGHRIP